MNQKQPKLIVGIGASAGGLRPIEEFFRTMPLDSGMAFVVVQHLSPHSKSLMDELLARYTEMPIHRVTDGIKIEPNQIYLIPPRKDLKISDGCLVLCDQVATGGLNLPIDSFFRSLAQQAGKDAVAIVLSGSGSDGARGVPDIHRAGGLVIAQSPETASFDSMPKSSIKTGLVDQVCEVGDMSKLLLKYFNHRDHGKLPSSDAGKDIDKKLAWMFKLYEAKSGIDFSLYKPATIHRRVDRRVQLGAFSGLDEYRKRVESDEDESDALFRDLLVEVTKFFRDPEAFEIMRTKVIPDLVANAGEEEFRAWVCGCATGEEAYSIAMLVDDCMQKAGNHQKLFKVFATDVHQGSIQLAGEGIYPPESLKLLPDGFLDRYFVKRDDSYQIKPDIRQNIIFAENNATNDPPFTKLDLITCRNMLIYLRPKTQQRVLSVFHYGLRKGGVLFLGPSETLLDLKTEFQEISRQWRIFRKRRDVRLLGSQRVPMRARATGSTPAAHTKTLGQLQKQSLTNLSLNGLVSRYVPPSLLIGENNELIHSIGKARHLLSFPEGSPSSNVLQLLKDELRVTVSAALHQCRKNEETVSLSGVNIQFPKEEDSGIHKLQVETFMQEGEQLCLISFIKLDETTPEPVPTELNIDTSSHTDEHLRQMKLELDYTRETLQSTVEELESSNEELQATNEELVASNEELQSTNEELHSTNEELHTVNQESQQRIEQFSEVTEDLELLLGRTSTGVLFLDRDLNIRKFTRSVTSYFDLCPADIGRSIKAFRHQTGVENLYQKLHEVIATGSEFTLESSVDDYEDLIVEIAVRRENEVISGAMLTVGRKTSLGFGVGSRQFYLPLGAGFWQWPDVKSDEMWWSPKCYELLGMDVDSMPATFSSWRDLVHEEDVHRMRNAGTKDCLFVQKGYLLIQMKCADGRYRKFEYRAAFVMDDCERPKSMMGSFGLAPTGERANKPAAPNFIEGSDLSRNEV